VLLLNPLRRRAREIEGFPVWRGGFPLLGHVPALASDTLAMCRDGARELGSLFFIEAGFGKHMLMCTHPDALSVFQAKAGSNDYMRDASGRLFGEAVIVQDGKPHQRMRAVLNGSFTPRGLSAASVGPMIAQIVERRVRSFARGEPIRMLAQMREMALDVVFRIVGIDDPDLSEWRRRYEDAIMLLINLPLDLPGLPRYRGRTGKAWIDERLHEKIRRIRATGKGEGLLATLVNAKGENGETISDDELVDNLRLVMLAGHETSASTMAWIVAYLADRPELWERLVAEARALGHVPTTPAELRRVPFAEAVFREALRMHPPVAFDARRMTAPIELCGRTIAADTLVGIAVIHLSRHPDLHRAPDTFDPDRWLGERTAITPVELMQFGGGAHFCLGYHLAWMEIVQFTVALALVAAERGTRPRLVGGKMPAPRYAPLLHPSKSLRITFE
jgi:cytochrome P450